MLENYSLRHSLGLVGGMVVMVTYYELRTSYPFWPFLVFAFVVGCIGNIIAMHLPR